MTNQIAIKVHTNPLDEVICDVSSHIYQYETGGYAFHSGVGVKLLHGENGKITLDQVIGGVNGDFDWLPQSKLVVIENTCNKAGGSYYTLDEIRPISDYCRLVDIKIHLDGARLFNALVETKESTLEVGAAFDSISICLSKGLGAPVGSLLIGDAAFIKQARRFRKVMGGGMRQAGFLAAAGIYALKNNIKRLKIDNQRASQLAQLLETKSYVRRVRPVMSNIVIFESTYLWTAREFVDKLAEYDILAVPMDEKGVRLTMHLDITDEMFDRLLFILDNYSFSKYPDDIPF